MAKGLYPTHRSEEMGGISGPKALEARPHLPGKNYASLKSRQTLSGCDLSMRTCSAVFPWVSAAKFVGPMCGCAMPQTPDQKAGS
eukprot:scaffold133518_cov15-Tisochrysis_lutea.AAC.1